jgi:hypothetical protein
MAALVLQIALPCLVEVLFFAPPMLDSRLAPSASLVLANRLTTYFLAIKGIHLSLAHSKEHREFPSANLPISYLLIFFEQNVRITPFHSVNKLNTGEA